MSPPAALESLYSRDTVRNYSLIDDLDFNKTWDLLGTTALETDDGNIEQKHTTTTDSYFDAGLNLDRIFKSSKTAQSTQPPTAKPPPPQLPKYNLVQMLQKAFGLEDAVKSNRFLNAEVGKQITSRRRTKRVTFTKTELSDHHLPHCRRAILKQEFGHLHAPKCRNYEAEQRLNKQDFLIRGNFIRNNTILAKSTEEFYYTPPVYKSDCPAATTEERSQPDLPLNLKQSAMDSINYHERNSPGLRSSPPQKPAEPKQEYKPMSWQPQFTDDVIISSPPITPRPTPSASLPRQRAFSDSTEDLATPVAPASALDSGFSSMPPSGDSDSDDGLSTPEGSNKGISSPDSGTGSMCSEDEDSFDDEDLDIDSLIQKNVKKPAAPKQKMWFAKGPVTPTQKTAPVTDNVKTPDPTDTSSPPGYVNPFKKHSEVRELQIKEPSVLAQLVCETKHVVEEDRRPAPTHDSFLFDTPSPDDVIRSRQAGILC